jgi:hypothetical protein
VCCWIGVQRIGGKHLRFLKGDEHGVDLGAVCSGQLQTFSAVVLVDADSESLYHVRTKTCERDWSCVYLEPLCGVEPCIGACVFLARV